MAKQKTDKKITSPEKKKTAAFSPGLRFYSVAILLFSFAIYFNSVFNDYNMDDELVTQHHKVTSKGWEVLKLNFDVFGKPEFRDSSFITKFKFFMPVVFRVPYYEDRAGYKYEYRPMVLFSFAAEHMLFAQKDFVNGTEVAVDNPHISHFINVILYSLLCLLLFYVLAKLLKQYDIIFPFIITLLFAAHPIHTEVVASIKNRDEILALIFGLLSLLFSIRFIDSRKLYCLFLLVFFFFLGILSKPSILTFAVLIPLSLAMLTNASYRNSMLITALLALPAVFYSRLPSVNQQIGLVLVLLLATSAFYMLKNFDSIWSIIKKSLADFSKPADKRLNVAKDFKMFIKPANLIALVLFIIPAALLSGAGIYMGNIWLGTLPLLAITALYFAASAEMKLILVTPLSLVAIFIAIKFRLVSKPIESVLLVFLAGHILSRVKAFRIAGIVNYIMYALAGLFILHNFYFLLILLFAGFFYRKIFPVTVLAVVVLALFFVKKLFTTITGSSSVGISNLNWLLLIAAFVLLWRNKEKWLNMASAAMLPLVLIGYFTLTSYSTNNAIGVTLKDNYYKLKNIKAPNPAPVEFARPLRYVEFPIDRNDPWTIKAGTAMSVLGRYLKLVFIPYPMSYYYGYACIIPVSISSFGPLCALVIYLALFGLAIFLFRKNTLLSFSILFYLGAVSVFSNLFFPLPGLLGDRFLFIPSIGFCIALALILSFIFKQDFSGTVNWLQIKQPVKISLAAIVLLYSSVTIARNANWKDRLTLFRHDINVVENSAQAQNLLGYHLLSASIGETNPAVQKQLLEEAIPHFKKALDIYPKFLNASFDLGRTYELLQRIDEAYAQYQTTMTIDSSFTTPCYSMAGILDYRGNYRAAIPFFQKFLQGAPDNMDAYTALSFDYFRLGLYDSSIIINHRAIEVNPYSFNSWVNIAKTYTKMNQPDSALFYFEKARILEPNDPNLNNAIRDLRGK